MSKLIADLQHLKSDVQHLHDDIEHLGKDLETLAEKTGLDKNELPGLSDLKDHMNDLDAHTHDMLNHVAHIETEASF